MNAKQRDDWARAAADCLYPGKEAGLLELFARLDADGAPGRWQAGLCGAKGFSPVSFRLFAPALPRGTAGALGVEPPAGAPPEGFPVLSFLWDFEAGEPREARLYGAGGAPRRARARSRGEERLLEARPFRAKDFGEPVASALSELAALAPVRDAVVEPGTARWALRLSRGLGWPGFLALSAAAAFGPRGGQSALLMRALRVSEIAFDGEALWAHAGA